MKQNEQMIFFYLLKMFILLLQFYFHQQDSHDEDRLRFKTTLTVVSNNTHNLEMLIGPEFFLSPYPITILIIMNLPSDEITLNQFFTFESCRHFASHTVFQGKLYNSLELVVLLGGCLTSHILDPATPYLYINLRI